MSEFDPVDDGTPQPDPLREQLLDAAARVFASKGYHGTKIMDIVREAGLSSGAVYGRFASKDDLLMEAVLSQVERNSLVGRFDGQTVTQILSESSRSQGPLGDAEAMQLEAFIAARREPKVAAAIAKARKKWHKAISMRMVKRAIDDGSASPGADFESIIYLLESLNLGLMVQRGAGQYAPDADRWQEFFARMIAVMANPVD